MAGLLLSIDNVATNTYIVQNGVANSTIKAEKGGGWGGFDTSTVIWALYAPSDHPSIALSPSDPTDLTLPHSFIPKMSGRYLVRASAQATSTENPNPNPFQHFTAVYEVGSASGANVPATKETLEYNLVSGWSRSINHHLRKVQRIGACGSILLHVQNVHPTDAINAGTLCCPASIPPPGGLAAPTWSDPNPNGSWKDEKSGLVAWNNPLAAGDDSLPYMQELVLQVVPINSEAAVAEYVPLFYTIAGIPPGDRGEVVFSGFVPASTGGSFGDPVYIGANGAPSSGPGTYVRRVGIVASGAARTINPAGSGQPVSTTGYMHFNGDSRVSESVSFGDAVDNEVPVYDAANHSINWTPKIEVGIQPDPVHAPAANALTFWTSVAGTNLGATNAYFSSGKIGIGVISPNTVLDVVSTSTTGTIRFGNGHADASVAGRIGYNDSGSTSAFIGNTYSDNAATFGIRMKGSSAANEVVTVTGAGDVGIGITSPASKLHVDGGITVNGALILPYREVTGASTFTLADHVIGVDHNPVTFVDIFLPPATTQLTGLTFVVKDAGGKSSSQSGGNYSATIRVKIDPGTADLIDGVNIYEINTAYGSARFVCRGSGLWSVL